jgi:pyruvate/2-oxoglutarate/acetoin dehydrogenase E1 component
MAIVESSGMSAYKDAITASMAMLGKDPLSRFIGYGLTRPASAGRAAGAAGTLVGVPMEQRIETPVAENLMAGLAIGLSLKGYKPVVFYERCDFVINALDAIVNHADKLREMSRGQFNPAIIFRVVVGNYAKPLFTGITHTRNHAEAVRHLVSFPVIELTAAEKIESIYCKAKSDQDAGTSTMLVELKDLW